MRCHELLYYLYGEVFDGVIDTKTDDDFFFLYQFSEIQTYNEGAAGGYNYWIGFSNFYWIFWTYVTVSKV